MAASTFEPRVPTDGDRTVTRTSARSMLFAVYCAELDASYLIPIEDIRARQVAALRIDAPANGQTYGIRWAGPYVIGRTAGTQPTSDSLERKTRFELATLTLAT